MSRKAARRTVTIRGDLEFEVRSLADVPPTIQRRLRAHLDILRRIARTRRLSAAGRVGPWTGVGEAENAVAIALNEVLLETVVSPRLVRVEAEATSEAELWIEALELADKIALLDQIDLQ